MALVSTFELLVKSQLPSVPALPAGPLTNLSRIALQGYFLTIANVNFFDVTLSVVFTIKFPTNPGGPSVRPTSFREFLSVVDITGTNLLPGQARQAALEPEIVPKNNKARLTFTIPANETGLLLLEPNILPPSDLLTNPNFEARGYVEVFLSSLSGSDSATLLLTPEHRGTFFKNAAGANPDAINLDQIAYALPISNGGVFKLSNP